MKRTELKRKTPLKARSRPSEPSDEERAWKTGRGPCVVCRTRTPFRHHVVLRQHVACYAPGREDDLANGAWVCKRHHELHHSGVPWRISLLRIPSAAIDFAFEILGEFAPLYLQRRYADAEQDPRLRRKNPELKRRPHVYD